MGKIHLGKICISLSVVCGKSCVSNPLPPGLQCAPPNPHPDWPDLADSLLPSSSVVRPQGRAVAAFRAFPGFLGRTSAPCSLGVHLLKLFKKPSPKVVFSGKVSWFPRRYHEASSRELRIYVEGGVPVDFYKRAVWVCGV